MAYDGSARVENVELAKLAEQTERYEDMARYMKEVTMADPRLSSEERNLLSVAYKNVVGTRRSAWRIMSGIETKAAGTDDELYADYRKRVEKELNDICHEVLELLSDHLLPTAKADYDKAKADYEEAEKALAALERDPDEKEKKDLKDLKAVLDRCVELYVFYLKMKGDYYRYLAEFTTSDTRKNVMENSCESYKLANEVAKENMVPINAIRLGLALNFSVFYYEIMSQPDKACKMAKEAFDDAIQELDKVKDDSYKDTTLILQLLRDNITLWTSDKEDKDEDTEDQ